MCQVWFGVVLKKDIEENAYFAFRKTQSEVLNTPRLDCIHVSDLIKVCQRMPYLNKVKPLIGMSMNNAKNLYIGQLVHAQSDMSNIGKHEVLLHYNWVTDIARPVKKDNRWDWIAGAIDDVVKIDDEYIICDKKTTSKMANKIKYGPSDENKLQINMYRVLLFKQFGIDAKWGCNIFIDIDINSEYDKVHPVAYKLRPIEETLDFMVQQAENMRASLLDLKMPERTRNFMCDGICPHATFCWGGEND